ncbi:MAG: antibiotic biosynthesis monooxygenase family protein [Ktedonobacteraceae bacterium]
MKAPDPTQMTIVPDVYRHHTVTEVVKLPVKPENQQRLLDYVQRWHETVILQLPGFQGAALLKSTTGAVLVYVHWDSEDAIKDASCGPLMALYFEGLIPMLSGQPEVHICSVEMLAVPARQPSGVPEGPAEMTSVHF